MSRLPMTVLRAAVLALGFALTLPVHLGIAAWEWWGVWQQGLREGPKKEFDREASFTDWAQVMEKGRAVQAREERG